MVSIASNNSLLSIGGPEELQFVPANAALVAYADVHDIMLSDLRQRVRSMLPNKLDGQHDFQNETGINIETDIDHVIAAVVPATGDQAGRIPGLGNLFWAVLCNPFRAYGRRCSLL